MQPGRNDDDDDILWCGAVARSGRLNTSCCPFFREGGNFAAPNSRELRWERSNPNSGRDTTIIATSLLQREFHILQFLPHLETKAS